MTQEEDKQTKTQNRKLKVFKLAMDTICRL